MKKETIIAVFFGVTFGAVVAFFILAKNKELQLNKTKTIAPTEKINKSSKTAVFTQPPLEISEPQDGAIFSTKSIEIKGRAEKDALIIIQSPIKELIFRNEKEEFTLSFPLVLGENVINITMYPKDNQTKPQEKELLIYHLDEQL